MVAIKFNHKSPYDQAKVIEDTQVAIDYCQELLAHAQHESGERSLIWKENGELFKHNHHTSDEVFKWVASDFRHVRYVNKLLYHLYRSLDSYDKKKNKRVPHNIRHINLQFGSKLDNNEIELPRG